MIVGKNAPPIGLAHPMSRFFHAANVGAGGSISGVNGREGRTGTRRIESQVKVPRPNSRKEDDK